MDIRFPRVGQRVMLANGFTVESKRKCERFEKGLLGTIKRIHGYINVLGMAIVNVRLDDGRIVNVDTDMLEKPPLNVNVWTEVLKAGYEPNSPTCPSGSSD